MSAGVIRKSERDSDHDSHGGRHPSLHVTGPLADGAVLVASGLAANSVRHSSSRDGGGFMLRAEVHPDHLRIEVEDADGPWHAGPSDDGGPHGFDVVEAIAGSRNWAWSAKARG